MAPKSPKRASLTVTAKRAETPRSERARRRQDEREADEDDDADETEEEEESEDLHLQGVDGLSTAELRKLKDGMDILSKLTPDAISALNSRPLQTVTQVELLDHGDEVSHISTLIDRHIAPSLDRKTAAIYRGSKDLYDEPLEFWSRILSGIRPERPELLPSVAQYDHSALVDLRPVNVTGDVEAALKAKPRDQAQDDLLFKILDKPMRALHSLIIPALDYVNMPDLTKDYDDDFPEEISRALNASNTLLRGFATHTLALQSDLMHRRRILAKTALGASKQEAEGAKNVLDSWDRAELKTLAEQRKERAILAGNLFKRKVPEGGQRRKGGRGGGKGRFKRRDREEGSSPRRGESSGGDEAEQSAKKGSKDGSNKSTSTPGKKKFPRGKGK